MLKMDSQNIYNCLILKDDIGGNHWATLMEKGIKTIETRSKKFKYRGDLIICCSNESKTKNSGLAVCIVNLYDAIPMESNHEKEACIEAIPGRIAHLTNNLRHFNRKFNFTSRRISGSFQSIFQITLPQGVFIFPIFKK